MMDPITHGVIGAAISAFSGDAVSLSNPMTLGAVIGAMSPDLDVVVRLFQDEMHYLKKHRGPSHSLPALAAFSVVITGLLSFVFPTMAWGQVLLFTFLGALSHTFFDILNSYGAQLLKRKKKANLLSLYDPFISVMALYLILRRQHSLASLTTTGFLFTAYLGLRWGLKTWSKKKICAHYDHAPLEAVTIMPSLKAFHKWDFVLSTSKEQIVGKFNPLSRNIDEVESFSFDSDHPRWHALFEASAVGRYFKELTPNYHIVKMEEKERVVLKIVDLRYHFRNEFMHHATLHLDRDCQVHRAYMHPYSMQKRIAVHEAAS